MIIIVPTAKELNGIFGKINLQEWKYGILEGTWRGFRVFVSGITKTNASFASGIILSELKPEKALITGICGAYRQSGLKVGEIVSVEKDWFVDESVFLGNEIRLLEEEGFAVCKNSHVCFEPFAGLKVASSNTVSLLSSTDELAKIYQEKTKAEIENMEGASIGLSAQRLGVNISQVRSVSNFCGKRDMQEWDIKLALGSLNLFFHKMF